MTEPSALELAFQQLAKSMGVTIPSVATPSTIIPRENSNTINAEENNKIDTQSMSEPEGEEGELSDTPQQPPSSSSIKTTINKRKAPDFTGEVDAESLLRGSIDKKPVKKKPKPKKEQNKVPPKERPKVPCRYWMEGKCSKAESCTYSHAVKPNKTFEEARSTEICRYQLAGSCLKGDSCLYSHDLSKVPCRFFHVKGECAAGSACRFSHEALDEQTRHQLFAEVMGIRDPRLSNESPHQEDQLNGTPHTTTPSQETKAVPIEPTNFFNPAMFCKIPLDPAVAQYNPFGSPF